MNVLDFLSKSGVAESKSDARRAIKANRISIDFSKITDEKANIDVFDDVELESLNAGDWYFYMIGTERKWSEKFITDDLLLFRLIRNFGFQNMKGKHVVVDLMLKDTFVVENGKRNLFIVRAKTIDKMNKNNVEIERRFLLKKLPNIEFDEEILMSQFYCADGVRVREAKKLGVNFDTMYVKTIKNTISHGVNSEVENEISKTDFLEYIKSATHKIDKRRLIKNIGFKKWEVDVFSGLSLVIAEIELNDINQDLEIPDFIKDNLVMEITGVNEFTNRALSNKYTYEH